MGRIQVLDETLINQIAAGEVVERPASVVKELGENAIDAGARQVRIQLKGGGLDQIVVTDDGVGMNREDAVLCLQRHATSKLRDQAGLLEIMTKGFRGEAIPAIASVSRFVLETSEPGSGTGTKVTVEGGATPVIEDAAPTPGTRIEVNELFFNTPARRKFMRRDTTEATHCEEAVLRLALAHPEVSFFLESDGRTVLASPASLEDPRERIAAALGSEVHPHLLKIEERRLGLEVHGYICSPEFTLPTARGLYTFVNRRYVRDRGVNYAVQRAFQDALPAGRQPVVVIFIDLDPATVDVNVHPQKLEVRFQDARSVQDALGVAVGRALAEAPWRQAAAPGSEPMTGAHYASAVDRFLARAAEGQVAFTSTSITPAPLAFGQLKPGINQAPPPGYYASLRFIGELAKRYWVCEAPGGTLVVLDPRAVLERVRRRELEVPKAQPSLFTATVALEPSEYTTVIAHRELLERRGVVVEPFGGNTVALTSLPLDFAADASKLLKAIAIALPDEKAVLAVLAHQASEEYPRQVSHHEAQRLLQQLDSADHSLPGSDVVLHELTYFELQRRSEN